VFRSTDDALSCSANAGQDCDRVSLEYEFAFMLPRGPNAHEQPLSTRRLRSETPIPFECSIYR
jgi:hypothetical protein